MWRSLVLAVVAVVAVGGASLSALASDWTEQEVLVSVVKVSTGHVTERTVDGMIEDEETLYLQLADVFGAGGLAENVGVEWMVRDGRVYFPVGNGIEYVEIETIDSLEYVPVLETLAKLGVGRGLINQSHLMVEVW